MKFNEKLKQLRKDNNLTQIQLADKLNVSRSLVARWEYGDVYPNGEYIKDLSNIFNMSLNDLLDEEEKTELIIEQSNTINKLQKDLFNIFFFGVNVYGLLSPLIYFIKVFVHTTYTYTDSGIDIKTTFNSIANSIHPNHIWILITSLLLNIILLIFNNFICFKNKSKKKCDYIIFIIVFLSSILFLFLTIVVGVQDRPMVK